MDEIAEAGVVVAPPAFWQMPRAIKPSGHQILNELMIRSFDRRSAPVITSARASNLAHKHRRKFNTRALAASAALTWNNASTFVG